MVVPAASASFDPSYENESREILALTRSILDQTGPRPGGSDAARRAAAILADGLAEACDTVRREEFPFHPSGHFFGFKVVVAAYFVGTALLFVGNLGVILSPIVFLLGVGLVVLEFWLNREVFDPLLPKATGLNVWGVIEPEEPATRQVVLSAHYDSARVFRYLLRYQRYYALWYIVGFGAYFLVTGLSLVFLARGIALGVSAAMPSWFGAAALVGGIAVLPILFSFKDEWSPGAGDDLVSAALLVKVADLVRAARRAGKPLLRRTRLVLLATDGEEAGLRGARAWVRAHLRELTEIETQVLNYECLYRADDLRFTIDDTNGVIPLSRALAERCKGIAADLGYPSHLVGIPLGGGGTDAAEFARAGVEATTLLAMSTDLVREGLLYHTPWDLVEGLDPEATRAALRITMEFLRRSDREREDALS